MRRRDFLRTSAVVGTSALGGRVLNSGTVTAAATEPLERVKALEWASFTSDMRPWTRWWWLGSAVTEQGLARHLQDFADAGFGGVEVQPIYEAQEREEAIRSYLSTDWLEALDATTRHAHDHGLQVDLTLGSGWNFGGPWIAPEHSAGQALVERWDLAGGERLEVDVRTTQPPHPDLVDEEQLAKPKFLPPMPELPEPPLAALVAREAGSGETIDLTDRVGADRTLDWTAPAGNWELTGVFSGLVLKRVERAGPGGKGLMADVFQPSGINDHLERFGDAIGDGPRGIRALFHDSYENGRTDWTYNVLTEFRRLRGYNLVPHLPEIFTDAGTSDVRSRVLSDVRETFSDLFLEKFATAWTDWSVQRGWSTRNQAHGSPAHLLDVYGAASIPETEYTGGEIIPIPGLREGAGPSAKPPTLAMRFASSPAHVQGQLLVAAETVTWRDEHYHVSLSQAKPAVDVLFAAGINHIVFHGTTYSPEDKPWPGYSFYAATELKSTNTIWRDLPELTGYITRCQSVLQAGSHGNDVLVYWPQHDLWERPDGGLDSAEDMELTPDYGWRGEWIYGHPSGAGSLVEGIEARGWQFDWVSDRQLEVFTGSGDGVSNGHSRYAVVLVPGARLLPLNTVEKLHELASAGATVIFVGGLPNDVPGLADLNARRDRLGQLLAAMTSESDDGASGAYPVGSGWVVVVESGTIPDQALAKAGAVREPLADSGLRVLRRQHNDGQHYFLTNLTAEPVQGWWALGHDAASVAALDPLRDAHGIIATRHRQDVLQVQVRLEPGESLILRTFEQDQLQGPTFGTLTPTGRERPLRGRWNLDFLDGGPTLPASRRLTGLVSWTELGEPEAAFAGTARYTLEFRVSGTSGRDWVLDLGDVRESCRVRLNEEDLPVAWSIPFRILVGDALRDGTNVLEVEVTNLAANRYRHLARTDQLDQNVFMSWRTAPPKEWDPMPSGLLGPVRLVQVDG